MPTIAKNYNNILGRLQRRYVQRQFTVQAVVAWPRGPSQPSPGCLEANLNIHTQAFALCSLVDCSRWKVKAVC